jgi:predicted MPP superfamily phosphohydrolase
MTTTMPRTWTLVASVIFAIALVVPAASQQGTAPQGGVAVSSGKAGDGATALPNRPNSLKFLVLGDFGTGDKGQYALANMMVEFYKLFPVQMAILVGDNLYGSERPQDFKKKFETPYKTLLDGGVKFYASLGNHDAREQRYYKLFNMDGKLYYSFKAPKEDVRFIALESTYPVPEQIAWLEEQLKASKEAWKIVYFHHPLYSSGRTHGSDLKLRETLEPLFVKYGVSVVFTGHDHLYERMKLQQGIQYFVTGSGGALRKGDFTPNQPFSAKLVDNEQVFLAVEIFEKEMVFNAVSRSGKIVDSGLVIQREDKPKP